MHVQRDRTGTPELQVLEISGLHGSAPPDLQPLCSLAAQTCVHIMPLSSSVAGVKARCKTALGPGYSLMAWMRLSQGADLSGGVGAVDMDDDEATWREWEITEVSKHNSPEDAWMVIHGKVYNVTPYLPYHPGGVSTLLKEAGGDGTAAWSGWSK